MIVTITRPDLPYDFRALEPAMSRESLYHHFSLHERGCYEQVLTTVRGTELEELGLEDLIRVCTRAPGLRPLYREAAGIWNHNFFWKSMRAGGGGAAQGAVADLIRSSFGSYEEFVGEFAAAAAGLTGNGWLWVMWEPSLVYLLTTTNCDTVIGGRRKPLLVLDLWEHAYYLDHQNRRGAYVRTFLEELVDWDFANRNCHAHEAARTRPLPRRPMTPSRTGRPTPSLPAVRDHAGR